MPGANSRQPVPGTTITSPSSPAFSAAFTLPMALCWPDRKWPVRTVPVVVNTVQAPLPSAARCYQLGQAIGRAIASWPKDERVVVMGTGGLSHQLEGERAGFINKEFDLQFMDSMIRDPAWATKYSTVELVELSGTQGVELLSWVVARRTLPEKVRRRQANYHIPYFQYGNGIDGGGAGGLRLSAEIPWPHSLEPRSRGLDID